MTPVRANDKIRVHLQVALRRFCAHADHTRILHQQIDDFGFHVQLEFRKTFSVTGEKIKKIPLGHERDEFATRGKFSEISDRHDLAINHSLQLAHFLMRLFQELVEQPELMHQLERRWMNGVAAKITVEISVFFEDSDGHASSCEQITSHHTCRTAARDHEDCLQFINLRLKG